MIALCHVLFCLLLSSFVFFCLVLSCFVLCCLVLVPQKSAAEGARGAAEGATAAAEGANAAVEGLWLICTLFQNSAQVLVASHIVALQSYIVLFALFAH
jgi:preprotein translocase subunit SecG